MFVNCVAVFAACKASKQDGRNGGFWLSDLSECYILAHACAAAASRLHRFVLAAIKSAAPGSSKELNALEKKLNEAFDPYAN